MFGSRAVVSGGCLVAVLLSNLSSVRAGEPTAPPPSRPLSLDLSRLQPVPADPPIMPPSDNLPAANLPAPLSSEPAIDHTAIAKPKAAIIPTPTLGGSQFWGDVKLRSGWRIQRQVFSGKHRLLDPNQLQHAAGTKEDCLAVLDATTAAVPMTGEVTILIHGILRGSNSMGRVGKQMKAAGLQPLRFDYPSTQSTIEEAADCLVQAVATLDPGVTRVNFVVHSMGGLVVRAFGRQLADDIAQRRLDPSVTDRLGRLVMIATPNHGAELASHLKNFAPFQAIFGPAGRQLAHNEQTIAALPLPPCEFGIIAGVRGTTSGFNPFIPGDDDGTVTLASARLAGASDFLAVKGMHSFLIYQSNVVQAVQRFLATGAFRESGEREPIAE